MEIVFGVNFFVGRNTSGTPGKTDGPMNMTNLRNWLAMNVDLAYPAFRGIELGNELSDSVPVSVYAADVLRARALVDELYSAVPPASRPWVVAAADNFWDLPVHLGSFFQRQCSGCSGRVFVPPLRPIRH